MGSRSEARARAQANGDADSGQQPRLRALLVAGIVEAIETAGIFVASVFAAISAAEGKSYQSSSGIAITAIGFGTVIALAFVSWGLARGKRWSRTPALLTQLFGGILGILMLQAQRYWWGVPAVILSVAGFASLLMPSSFRALSYGRTHDRAASAK